MDAAEAKILAEKAAHMRATADLFERITTLHRMAADLVEAGKLEEVDELIAQEMELLKKAMPTDPDDVEDVMTAYRRLASDPTERN